VTGDCHARFYESRGVRIPSATHLDHEPLQLVWLQMMVRSSSSRRSVPIQRSANVFATGVRTGLL
jgi:hypothetical protein